MATRRPARIPEDLARDMILNGWDEEPIGGIDSGSDISDVEDPEYCPSGHVRPSETQSAPAEQDQSETEESSESSEEEIDIVSNRMSRIKFDVLQTHGHPSIRVHCYELTQPGSTVVRPGQSLTIDCKVSYSVTSYDSAWIRQPAGKALEWVGRITSGGGTAYSDKLKIKFSISRNSGTNTITLQGQNLQTEDTAVYYCARESQ
ncbi:hypothetical protein MHYP_G00145700 [Metynnis hypsauchen]